MRFDRVMNVIKQWIIHHFYDFERDPSLQITLEEFLENADDSRGKSSIFESVRRCLKKAVRKLGCALHLIFNSMFDF